jgi:hypothetical protein
MSLVKYFLVFIVTPAMPHDAFKTKVTFCVTAVFTPVLAKHSKLFSLIDRISVGVDGMQRNFEPMRKQVEAWQRSELTDVTTKVVIYEAFVRVNWKRRSISPARYTISGCRKPCPHL